MQSLPAVAVLAFVAQWTLTAFGSFFDKVIIIRSVRTQRFPSTIDALQPFRAAAGHWTGKSEWSGARTGGGPMTATYYETGAGSAVVENLETDGVPMMTTVYHLDGPDLRATHFCAARNQPRLKASSVTSDTVDFDYVDATNLASAGAPHVAGLQVHFVDASHLVLTFRFHSAKGDSLEKITLARVAPK